MRISKLNLLCRAGLHNYKLVRKINNYDSGLIKTFNMYKCKRCGRLHSELADVKSAKSNILSYT